MIRKLQNQDWFDFKAWKKTIGHRVGLSGNGCWALGDARVEETLHELKVRHIDDKILAAERAHGPWVVSQL